jgi:hypothetical protein
MGKILYWIGAIMVAFWLVGLLMHFAGMLIHLLLVVAVVFFLVQFFIGRSRL